MGLIYKYKINFLEVCIFMSMFGAGLISVANASEYKIIVNKNSTIDKLSPSQIKRIFLGKIRRLSSGERAVPLDLSKNSAIRKKFYSQVICKSQSQMNAYWMRLVFTGKGRPPEEVSDSDAMLEKVASVNGYIAYIKAEKLSDKVKEVMIISEGGIE